MTSARYQGISAQIDNLQKKLPEYVKKAGWNVKKVISFPNSVMFELKRGFFDKAVINVKQIAQDVTLDVEGSRELMDIAETALIDSCDNPAVLVGWKEQERKQAQEVMSSATAVAAAQPQTQAANVQVDQPAASKLAAPFWKRMGRLACAPPLTTAREPGATMITPSAAATSAPATHVAATLTATRRTTSGAIQNRSPALSNHSSFREP